MRKPPFFLLLGLALFLAHAAGQDASNHLDGTLVECGTDRVVILEGTASKDGHFAVAWTLRPKPGKPPVDWSAYDHTAPAAFAKRYQGEDSTDWPPDNGYQLVNGLVDLRAKTFTPLPGSDPYFPGEQHCHLDAAWSEDRHGSRYGVIINAAGNRHDESTVDLCLAFLGAGGARFVDLKPAADHAVREYLHRRDPRDYQKHEWSYDFDATPNGSKPLATFRGDVLTIHFNADIPDHDTDFDSGRVLFALPKGSVTGTSADK